MHEIVCPRMVDEFLESLKDDYVTAEKRLAVTRLLIAEEDRFSRDLEQLELAFDRVASGQAQSRQIRRLRDRFGPNSEARVQAERLLATTEATQKLLEAFFEQFRLRYQRNSLSALPKALTPGR